MLYQSSSQGVRMRNFFQVILVIIGFLLVMPVHSLAGEKQDLSRDSPYGNLTDAVLSIDSIHTHCVNDTFNISGTTSLPAGTKLRVTVTRGSYNPGIPPQRNPWYDELKKETRVVADSQRGNVWVYTLNTTGSYPDEYLLTIEPYAGEDVNATAFFNLQEICNASENTADTTKITPAPVNSTQKQTTGLPTQKTADIPFFVPLNAMAGFGIIRILTSRKRVKKHNENK